MRPTVQATAIAAAVAGGAAVLAIVVAVSRQPKVQAAGRDVEGHALESAGAAAAQAASAASDAGVDAPTGPHAYNVVLVTIDTLRWDLGYMGYPRPITPNLDRLAARAAVYERAYAMASFTPKSVGPMLIGRYVSETFRDGQHYTTFYPANVFVAERIHDAGHRTLAAMCHHYFKWRTGFEQGFDVWDTSAVPPAMVDNDPTPTSATLTDAAIALLSRPENVAGPGRFFAWFHYMDPHQPYVAHDEAPDLVAAAPDAAPPDRALYDQEVWFTDSHVGRLLDFIAAQPWAKDTAIIVTADHGEAFGEHGFFHHGREVWETLVRVPLLVHVPGAAPRRIGVKRSHVDLVPTILDLMGVAPPEAGVLRGKSLVPEVAGDPHAPREDRDLYIDMPEGPFNQMRRALLTGGTPGVKLIDYGEGRMELYDLDDDPLETRPVRDDPDRLRDALARMKSLRSELREVPAAP